MLCYLSQQTAIVKSIRDVYFRYHYSENKVT